MKIKRHKIKDAGFILVTVLLMIVALSLIGITGMIVSSNEVLIAGHINKSKEAFYIAEAALEEVKYKVLNDPMKGMATSVTSAPNTIVDTSQNWGVDALQGMQVVDIAANVYTIQSNTTDTLTLSAGTAPLLGTYYIIFSVTDRGKSGVNGVGTLDTFTVLTEDWSATNWSGCALIDSASNEFTISGNAVNTLSVTGTPADGNWSIICNRGTVDQMSISDPAYTLPAYINTYQDGWILVDSNGGKYNIDDVGGFAGNAIFLQNGAGTPVDGSFTVTRPGWMYDPSSTIQGDGITSTFTNSYAIGPATGTGAVTVQRQGATKGSYNLIAVGTLARSNKAISLDLSDSGAGDAMFSNWHETTPP